MAAQQNPNLTEDQKKVLFEKATEAPFTGTLLQNNKSGGYACANCRQVLFDSESKFDSGSGWPSFYDVKDKKAIRLIEDTSHGMQRVEITCANCGAHMGHVFNDGPPEKTGMRFCINSLSLDFIQNKQKD